MKTPPIRSIDLTSRSKVERFKEPAKKTQSYFILDLLRSHGISDDLTDSDIARITGFSPNSVRPRRGELVKAGLVVSKGYKYRNETVWRATTPKEIQVMKDEEKARSASPEQAAVIATEEEKKELVLKLPHCGELLVKPDEVAGWFHPIPLSMWSRIIGFHRFISVSQKAESVSYHRFNPVTGKYDTIIPFQRTARGGLHVSTPWADDRNKQLLDNYAKRWGCEFFPANTIHTHVDAGAFESGTDAGDEEDLPGWHITLGHLVSHIDYDLHCRFRLPKIPRVKKIIDLSRSFNIPAKHLFERGVKPEQITRQPDNNKAWHTFLNRVSGY